MATVRVQTLSDGLFGISHRPFQAYSSLQGHFLTRLYRLEVIRKELAKSEQEPDQDIDLERVVKYATYATWRDCLQHGVEQEAREILKLAPFEVPQSHPVEAQAVAPKRSRKRQTSRT